MRGQVQFCCSLALQGEAHNCYTPPAVIDASNATINAGGFHLFFLSFSFPGQFFLVFYAFYADVAKRLSLEPLMWEVAGYFG